MSVAEHSKVPSLHSTVLLNKTSQGIFSQNFPKLSEQLFLSGRVLLNFQTFLKLSAVSCHLCVLEQVGWPILKINVSIVRCDGYAIGYDCVELG